MFWNNTSQQNSCQIWSRLNSIQSFVSFFEIMSTLYVVPFASVWPPRFATQANGISELVPTSTKSVASLCIHTWRVTCLHCIGNIVVIYQVPQIIATLPQESIISLNLDDMTTLYNCLFCCRLTIFGSCSLHKRKHLSVQELSNKTTGEERIHDTRLSSVCPDLNWEQIDRTTIYKQTFLVLSE